MDRTWNINKIIRDVGDAETKQYDEFDNQPRSGRQIMRVDFFNVIIVECRAEHAGESKLTLRSARGLGFSGDCIKWITEQRSDKLVSPYSDDLNLSLKDEYLQLRHYTSLSLNDMCRILIPPLYA